jgi:GNAT superfamily N-acetyltransferase
LEELEMAIIIREATINDIHGIAKVHVDAWNTTYKGIVPEEHLKSKTCKGQEEKWLKRIFNNIDSKEFLYVAEYEKSGIVGFACGSAENDDSKFKGAIRAIYILKEFQRQGIGKKLVRVLVERMNRAKVGNLIIWAFEQNPSCAFYEHIGGQKAYESNVVVGGKELTEVGYGWTDLDELLGVL